MKQTWAAQKAALATVRGFNAANGKAWFWLKIAAALVSKHHWLIIACDACGTVVDLDLRTRPRDPEASFRVALRSVQCPRCNGPWPPAHHWVGAAAVSLCEREGKMHDMCAGCITLDCALKPRGGPSDVRFWTIVDKGEFGRRQ